MEDHVVSNKEIAVAKRLHQLSLGQESETWVMMMTKGEGFDDCKSLHIYPNAEYPSYDTIAKEDARNRYLFGVEQTVVGPLPTLHEVLSDQMVAKVVLDISKEQSCHNQP